MIKNGQAEYAYGIMKRITERLFADKLITLEEFKNLDDLNKKECFSQFCTERDI